MSASPPRSPDRVTQTGPPRWTVHLYRWSSWVPLGSFAAAQLYLSRFDGWGSWAAAPVLLGPIGLSAALMVAGLGVLWSERRAGGTSMGSRSAFALASGPFVWFLWRVVVVQMGGA